MKFLISSVIPAIIISVSIAACTANYNTDNNQSPISPEDPEVTDTQQIKGRVIEDTIIGHWSIKTSKDSNDVIVSTDYYTVRDSSVFLTLSYDHNVVYSDKEIRTKDVVGNEGEFIMQSGGYVFWASDSAIYLSFGCYIPDSDFGWNMLYQILPDGTSALSVIQEEMGIDGFDVIAQFMPLYLNERAVGASVADMNRLYEHYCTKEIAEELSAGTIRIASDDTDFRHADRTTRIDNLDDLNDLPLEKYSFKVEFKPNPKDENITDILYMEVDYPSNKISKIDGGFRKVI